MARKSAHHVELKYFSFVCIMALPRPVTSFLSCVLLCFAAVILVLSLVDNHYIKWWFHTYSPPHDTDFEGKYHFENEFGKHELELIHSGQVKITSTLPEEQNGPKMGPVPVYWVNKHEGKIVSDGMSFEQPQLIKLLSAGNSKTIQWTKCPDETVANVHQNKVMIGYREPIDVLEYLDRVDLLPVQEKTFDITGAETRDISVNVKIHGSGAKVTHIDKEHPTVFTKAH